ncbi:MAG: GerMN domain-containing protein [Candidatus Goldbacteria bacterium]|nr:GerMN domain-containing protein [Candidatus Goldiibacteriota bacterium]
MNATQKISTQYSSDEKLRDVVIFYGDPKIDGLKSYSTKIPEAGSITNQVKQVLNLMFDMTPQDCMRVIPEGTTVREVFIDSNSILYIDLSEEFMINNKGGTTLEFLSVYSILKSIFLNFKDIRGVKLLINGIEQETIAGHLSIGDIFRPTDINL